MNKYKIEYLLFLLFGKLLSLLGFTSIKFASSILAFIFFRIIRIRRDVVEKNLSIAFPELTSKEVAKLAYNNYKSISITFLEIFNFPATSREFVKSLLSEKGFDLIKARHSEGKGVILLTAHFGNWELGALATGIHLNQKINVLVKEQRNIYVSDWLKNMREKFGNVEVPLGVSVRELFRALKNKEIVGVVGDQRGPRKGPRVNFFNKETAAFTGTAAIAFKTQSPVMVLLCARQPDGKYEYIVEELIYSDFNGSKEENIQQFNQAYMSILEKAIRKYPEQWFWMHNIWKY